MKKYLLIIAVLAVGLLVWYFVINTDGVTAGGTATYSNVVHGFEFTYPTGPEGYVVQEAIPADESQGLLLSIMLVPTKDMDQYQNPPQGGEGPATINISVLRNVKKQQALNWANENIQWSNVNLKTGDVSNVVVGGANAIRYSADGLYASDNVIVAHGENMYVLSGMYLDAQSKLKQDFSPIVESLRFIPQPNQQ